MNKPNDSKHVDRQRTENRRSYQRGRGQGEGKMSKGTNCMVMEGN